MAELQDCDIARLIYGARVDFAKPCSGIERLASESALFERQLMPVPICCIVRFAPF